MPPVFVHLLNALHFSCFVIDDLPQNYDDVVIVPQFCNDNPGGGVKFHPSTYKHDIFILFFFSSNYSCTFILSDGVQEKYDDLKNVREYASDMFGTLLALYFP